MKSRNNYPFHLLTLGCGLLLSGMFSHSARAANGSWTGLGTGSLWGTNANWTGATPPGTGGQIATFNGAGNSKTTIDLGAGVSVSNIVFDTAIAAAYTLGSGAAGSQTLTLNTAVTMNSTVVNNQLFNANLVLGTAAGSTTFTLTNSSTTNSLTFAGGVSSLTTGTKTLAVATAGNTAISGNITTGSADAIVLTKSGAGTLTLSGANNYSGATSIGAGAVIVNNGNSGGGSYSLTGANTTLTIGGGTVLASTLTTTANSNSRSLNLNGGVLQTTGNVFASGTAGAVNINGGTLKSGNSSGITISDDNNSIGIAVGGATLDTAVGNITSTAVFNGSAAGAITVKGGNTFASGITNTGLLSIQDNSTWNVNGVASSVAGLSGINGTISNSGAAQTLITNFASGTNAFGGVISGGANLALTKSGAGIQILTGANTYTGNTTISTGTLQIGNAGTTGSLSASSAITNNGNLTFNRTNAVVQGTDFGTITSGTGSLTQAGSNTLTLNTANTYSGGTTVKTGVLAVQNGGALGTGDVTIEGGGGTKQLALSGGITLAGPSNYNIAGRYIVPSDDLVNAAIVNTSGDNTISGSVRFAATGGSWVNIQSLAGTLTLGGDVTATVSNSRSFNFTGAGDITIGGVVSNGSATPVGISKGGAGTLTLSGTNTYTGETTIAGGTLALSGTGSIANSSKINVSTAISKLDVTGLSGDFTVAASQTLAGIGTVLATGKTVNASGTIAPGNSPGTITIDGGTLALDGTSKFQLELGTASDLVSLLNSATLALGSGTLGLADFTFSDSGGFGVGTYTLVGGAASFTGSLDSGDLTGSVLGLDSTLSMSGNNLVLTVVPEPSSTMLIGTLVLFSMLGRRKRPIPG